MTYESLFGPHCETAKHMTINTPWGMRVRCHKSLVSAFQAACGDAYQVPWKPQRIDGYNCRQIRDSTAWSKHAYAAAWDFFATGPNVPPPGGVWTPDNAVTPEFAECFTRRGFTWGATFTRKDVPHIEWRSATLPKKEEDMALTQEDKDFITGLVTGATNGLDGVAVRETERVLEVLAKIENKIAAGGGGLSPGDRATLDSIAGHFK